MYTICLRSQTEASIIIQPLTLANTNILISHAGNFHFVVG